MDGNFIFEANLWYDSNKHFNVYQSESKRHVFLFGESMARTLEARLLDATKPNNYEWIEIEG